MSIDLMSSSQPLTVSCSQAWLVVLQWEEYIGHRFFSRLSTNHYCIYRCILMSFHVFSSIDNVLENGFQLQNNAFVPHSLDCSCSYHHDEFIFCFPEFYITWSLSLWPLFIVMRHKGSMQDEYPQTAPYNTAGSFQTPFLGEAIPLCRGETLLPNPLGSTSCCLPSDSQPPLPLSCKDVLSRSLLPAFCFPSNSQISPPHRA